MSKTKNGNNVIKSLGFKDLITLEGNPRKAIDTDQVDRLKYQIEKHGFRGVLDVFKEKDGRYSILCGNHRFKAARELGIDTFPCQEYTGTRKEALARAIADNKTNEWTEWDYPLLKDMMVDLDDGEFDMELTAFSGDEISALFDEGSEELEGEDEAPEATETAQTKLGGLYQLGEHRLLCGDSTAQSEVERLMDGVKADMVFTDPPYNIDYQGVKDKRDRIENDKMPDEQFVGFLSRGLMSSEAMYVCCSWQYCHLFKEALAIIGKPVKAMIVWDKVNPAQNLDKYFKQHEIIFYSGEFGGQKTIRGDVWQLKRQQNTVHPTMKPVELIEMALLDHPKKRTVFDGFGGSGSTLIACEKLNRKCYMMEISPQYCDVIIKRYHNLFPDKEIKRLVPGAVATSPIGLAGSELWEDVHWLEEDYANA